MHLPNVIVIGAMKAGTSSLHNYLKLHPEIYACRLKELDYFLWNEQKGIDWYKNQFPVNRKIRVESSPNYTKFFPEWEYPAKKIFRTLPGVKLIYILRNPVERSLSQCRHHYLDPNKTIPDLLKNNVNHEIISSGKYHLHLLEYYKYFSPNQILVLLTEELNKTPERTLGKISQFLEIEKFDLSDNIHIHENVSANFEIPRQAIKTLNKNKLYTKVKNIVPRSKVIVKFYHKLFYDRPRLYSATNETRKVLNEYFDKDIEELESLLSISFDEWRL